MKTGLQYFFVNSCFTAQQLSPHPYLHLSLKEIYYPLSSFRSYLFFFQPHFEILVPQLADEHVPHPRVEVQSPNHWTTSSFLHLSSKAWPPRLIYHE